MKLAGRGIFGGAMNDVSLRVGQGFGQQIALKMLRFDAGCSHLFPDFLGNVVASRRGQNAHLLLGPGGQHQINGAAHVRISRHDQRPVVPTQGRMMHQMDGQIDVALFFLVGDPFRAATLAPLLLGLEAAQHRRDPKGPVCGDKHFVPPLRLGQPKGQSRKVVHVHKLFLVVLHKGGRQAPEVDPFQVLAGRRQALYGVVEVETVNVTGDFRVRHGNVFSPKKSPDALAPGHCKRRTGHLQDELLKHRKKQAVNQGNFATVHFIEAGKSRQ